MSKLLVCVIGIIFLTIPSVHAQAQDSKQIPKGELIRVPILDEEIGGLNEKQFDQRKATERFIFEEDFETGAQGWEDEGSWQVGEPESGPGEGFNSVSVAGTNLSGNYPNNANDVLITPLIELPDISENRNISLRFREWFEIESGYDYGYLDISTDNGQSWTTLKSRDGYSEWRQTEVDLTSYAGEDIYLRFRLSSDDFISFSGWYIDDVTITEYALSPLSSEITSINSQNFPNIYANIRIDSSGVGFPDLTQDDFTVYENSTIQTNLFNVTPPQEGGGVRRADIIFLMDNSGSMSEEQDAVESNVFNFVDALAASNVDFSLGLVRYGANENSGNPIFEDNGSLTSDAGYFKNDVWLRNEIEGGDEPGYYAMTEAMGNASFRPGAQRIFIIITDESPNQGGSSQIDAFEALEDGSTTLFALTESSLYHYFEPLTTVTGGDVFNIYSPFSDILDYIAEEVASSYVVSYRTDNPEYDGIPRTVRIEVNYEGNTSFDEVTYIPGAAPSIQRTEETIALSDEGRPELVPLSIVAEITDDLSPGVQRAQLIYKNTLDSASVYISVDMTNTSGNIYQADIPADAVVRPGMDYYITATDGNTTSSSPSTNPGATPSNIAVLPNEPPAIEHTPVTQASADQPIEIAFNATDQTRELERVQLYYRQSGQLKYENETFENFINQSDFLLRIPAEFVSNDGVEYYIEAEDDWGVASTLPKEDAVDEPYSIEVNFSVSVKIIDVNDDLIPFKEFKLYNISENGLLGSSVGKSTTNRDGQLDIDLRQFSEGDQIKIERKVHTELADDNPAYAKLDGVRYRIFIDNAEFDTEGDISYPTVSSGSEISLEHTTIVQNLAVSVEWDATEDYLVDILEGMKRTSNYMYDVTDGQFYIGKVAVFDNKKYWNRVDVQRYANNQLRPVSPDFNRDFVKYFLNRPAFRMPRIWKLTFDLTRNHVYTKGDLSFPYDFKTVGHELGHYLFSFKDEYDNASDVKVWEQKSGPTDPWNFGFMDSPQTQYKGNILGGEYASEMSSLARYPSSQYKVTWQWQEHGTSCWGTFTNLFEDTHDDIFCPIKTPNQRDTGNRDYLVGPNNDLDDLTIDVGSSIEDSLYEDANTGAFAKKILLFGDNGSEDLKILSAASVTLVGLAGTTIDQGKTADNGGIVILGAHEGDVARYYKKDNGSIYSGEITITNENNKRNKSLSSSSIQSSKSTVNSASQDSLIIEAKPLEGNFQTVATVKFNELNTINFSAVFKVPLPETPDFELYNNLGSPNSSSVSVNQGSQYSVSITEPLGESGFFSLIAEDNSSNRFFVDHNYILYDSLNVNDRLELSGPSGSGELVLDSLNTSMEKVLMLTASFPPIFEGLPESTEIAGDVQTITTYPSVESFAGTNALTIRYANSDLNLGEESSIKIFKWETENSAWEVVGGMVDTVRNAVVASIPSAGTYGAFTTELKSTSGGSEEGGFILEQNYPNPFTRSTTITYTITETQNVTLKVYDILGRHVATLVESEQGVGIYEVPFNARSFGLVSGVYIYRLITDDNIKSEKMMFIR